MFIAALAIVARNWKQLKCPSAGKKKQSKCAVFIQWNLLSNKKEQSDDIYYDMDEPQKYYIGTKML